MTHCYNGGQYGLDQLTSTSTSSIYRKLLVAVFVSRFGTFVTSHDVSSNGVQWSPGFPVYGGYVNKHCAFVFLCQFLGPRWNRLAIDRLGSAFSFYRYKCAVGALDVTLVIIMHNCWLWWSPCVTVRMHTFMDYVWWLFIHWTCIRNYWMSYFGRRYLRIYILYIFKFRM